MNKINHKMIVLARESRGYSQTELAKKLEIPQGNLSRMESGDLGVTEENLSKLRTILNYPIEFFYQENRIVPSDTHYRKSITLDQRTKLKAEAIMNIYKFNIESLLNSLELSIKNIPIINEQYDSPEKIARFLRSYWKVERGCINDLTSLIEANGIIVVQVDFETDKIDGRTIVADTGHPIIFINKNASGDRQRLTLSHELGHIILHLNNVPSFNANEEDEAFRFGIEFLMPLDECKYDLNDSLSIEKLADLKRIWKISMQAILFRAQKQGLVKVNRCRYIWSQFSSRGWKKAEPIEIPKEIPSLANRMVSLFITELEYSKADLPRVLKINSDEIDERYFSKAHKLRVA